MEVLQRVFTQGKEANTNLLLIHHHLANVGYHDSIKDEDYTTSQSEFLTHGWNAELIVTTFIQFFNMVFGRYTSHATTYYTRNNSYSANNNFFALCNTAWYDAE